MSESREDLISHRFKLSASKHILFQEILNEIIILNVNDENYLGLDQTGTRMWNVLLNSNTTKHAFDQLLGEYDVEPATLKKDLNNFINNLIENNLVKLTSA
jgi:hypothetical protein